ncbi:MAG: hypothetical protein COV38_03630 [Bdellovibrionales bacterium CG11_big_fil_rev_8_21_14_0_20_38_13]|nr:MAG: hypothetical protein COV38_03630 [Bdellovibrionales bacterium CG11_big_fil_rev_8_21_14_0_20_38_13]
MVIFCLVAVSTLHAQLLDSSDRGDASRSLQADDALLRERQLKSDSINREDDLRDLRLAKYALLAGNTSLAERYLDRLGSDHPRLNQIVARYSALSAFMQSDFDKTYQLVKSERLNIVNAYEEICLLRLMSLFALGKNHPDFYKISPEFDSCRAITYKYTDNDHFWLSSMKTIVQGKMNQLPGGNVNDFTKLLIDDDSTKLWMKIALYTNREKQIIKNIELLPQEAYLNIGIRELLGMAYYRSGDPKRAADFIEDLATPNSDNIRGDIALTKNELELAYGHFRLALKRKDDSLNALERAIPLSWLLEQWSDGIELLAKYVGREYDPVKLLALETALRIRKGQYDKSQANLRYLEEKLLGSAPLDIQLMISFVSLMKGDLKKLKESSAKACRSFDGLNCWIADQLLVWDDLTKTVKRTDKVNIAAKSMDEILAESSNDISELKEKILIDQRDIEELDSRNVKLQLQ